MAVQRFLGAAWSSVHGPSDPVRLLRWVCETGFRGLVPAPAPRSTDWPQVAAAAVDFPVQFPAVRASSVLGEVPETHGLASGRDKERQAAVAVVRTAMALGAKVATDRIVLEPGLVPLLGEVEAEDLGDPAVDWGNGRATALLARRNAGLNAALDAACRSLHGLCKSSPDTTFCLTAGRNLRSVADVGALTAIFEDLGTYRLAYWHDAPVAARREQVLGEPQGAWLEAFSNRLAGCTLGDARPEGLYLPPGAGGVDYPLLTSYLRRGGSAFPACLELDPAVAADELPGIRACLDKFGL